MEPPVIEPVAATVRFRSESGTAIAVLMAVWTSAAVCAVDTVTSPACAVAEKPADKAVESNSALCKLILFFILEPFLWVAFWRMQVAVP